MAKRWKIFIEGMEVDPSGDFSAQFTYSIDDINNFASRNTAFSRPLVLPGTANNKKTFGFVFEINSGNFYNSSNPNIGYNFNATKKAKCLVTMDGIQVFKGVLRLTEIDFTGNDLTFECELYGEAGGLMAAIGDSKLEDLDFSAYDHVLNVTNISGSWSTGLGSGYYYPLIDYGYTLDGVTFPLENFRPALHVKEYIDKIFTAAGYTYASTFFNTSFFKSLIIPQNQKKLYKQTVFALEAAKNTFHNATSIYEKIQFTSITEDNGFTYNNATKDDFTWNESDSLDNVIANIEFLWTRSEFTAQTIKVKIEKNGVPLMDRTFNTGASGGNIINESVTVTIANGDVLAWWVAYSGTPTAISFSSFTGAVAGNPVINVRVQPGDVVTMNLNTPRNVFQKDFITWLIKMFNLYIYEDKDTEKFLHIEPYIDFYDTTPANFLNWDVKLDRSQNINIKLLSQFNARTYEYKYKDDSDYYNDLYKKKWNETYGSNLFDTGFDFSQDKQTVDVGFSPSPLIGFSGTDRILSSFIKLNGSTREPAEVNIRILLRSATPITCTQWSISTTTISAGTASTVITNYTTYPYSGHLDDPNAPTVDINWGAPKEFYFIIVAGYLSANLVNVFWSFYLSEITDKDSKLLTGMFKLNPVDMYNLDFSKLIFVAGQLWRLNKIEDYSTDQPQTTKTELLKVIDITE